MTVAAEKCREHVGESPGSADHVHDLIQTMSLCLNGLWRYDQYIANADGKPELQQFWREFRDRELETVSRMKRFLAEELIQECKTVG